MDQSFQIFQADLGLSGATSETQNCRRPAFGEQALDADWKGPSKNP